MSDQMYVPTASGIVMSRSVDVRPQPATRFLVLLGAAFAALRFLGEVTLGDTTHPPASAPAHEVADFFATYRTGSIVGALFHILSAAVFFLFWRKVASLLLDRNRRVATAGAAAAAALLAGYAATTLVIAAGAPWSATATPATLYRLYFILYALWLVPVAVTVGVTAASAPVLGLGRRYAATAAAATVAFLAGGAFLARSGPLAPDGNYLFLLFWLLPVWMIVTARRIGRRHKPDVGDRP